MHVRAHKLPGSAYGPMDHGTLVDGGWKDLHMTDPYKKYGSSHASDP